MSKDKEQIINIQEKTKSIKEDIDDLNAEIHDCETIQTAKDKGWEDAFKPALESKNSISKLKNKIDRIKRKRKKIRKY